MQILKKNKKSAKRGALILHQFAPTELSVSGSPPCLKLETFLRMTKIPYQNDYRLKFSKKGKMPWIEFNGQEIADSNICIQFLKREFKVDIDSHLNSTEKAISHSVRTMLEENTYWALVYCRWLSAFGAEYRRRVFTKKFGHLVFPLKHLIARHIMKRIKRDLWGHGMGRHSEQELYGIAQRDLLAVSEILGQKKFLIGDKPCLADVALFAFVAASSWDLPESPFDELIKTKAQNLHTHAQRMKELYYPDWDEIISRNATSS